MEETGNLTSPGYKQDGSGSYPPDQHCFWTIIAPQGKVRAMLKHNQSISIILECNIIMIIIIIFPQAEL